jgi:hypothetical protein
MEILILIPIAFIIYGWMQTIPAAEPPPEANGNDFQWSSCEENDDSDFADSSDMLPCDAEFVSIGLEDDNTLWDNNSLSDDLMFNVAYSWCSFNIYHHDDPFDDFGMNSIDIFSEPFNTEISDSFSSVHSFDNF